MSAKKWLVSFILTVFGLLALLGGLNLAVDPFGIFGDRLFSWYSYDMTLIRGRRKSLISTGITKNTIPTSSAVPPPARIRWNS